MGLSLAREYRCYIAATPTNKISNRLYDFLQNQELLLFENIGDREHDKVVVRKWLKGSKKDR